MKIAALALVILSFSCNSDVQGVGSGGGGDDAGGAQPRGDDFGVSPPDFAQSIPLATPIDHVVIIVKENHTFDNYFGSFPGAEGTSVAQTSTGPVAVGQPPTQLTRDLCHSHDCGLADWNHGNMNHWDLGDAKNASDGLAYAQYTQADIPNYWKLAQSFTLADHFFSSMIGPSFPGHMFVLAAQTGWAIENPSQLTPWGCDDNAGTTIDVLDNGGCTVKQVFPCFKFPTVADLLPAKGLTWKFYGTKLPPLVGETWSMFDAVDQVRNTSSWGEHIVDVADFDQAAMNGTLPNVSWLVPQDQNSEHPPFNICAGENWTAGHIDAVMKGPLWSHTAILFTYDDFGGWYNHVPPPQQYGCDSSKPYGLGFRLPLIIISPYAKPGYVMKSVAHQASVPKFVEAIFGLPSLASMDPAAQDGPTTNDLLDAFDFTQAPRPPIDLPQRNCARTALTTLHTRFRGRGRMSPPWRRQPAESARAGRWSEVCKCRSPMKRFVAACAVSLVGFGVAIWLAS